MENRMKLEETEKGEEKKTPKTKKKLDDTERKITSKYGKD